ncbi:MAG: hypothetical protein IPL47_01970 [Phyllobacteriaceae bacterium]|nr:hypothetical protein [Phyllobacteriaceae bacterium]
MRDEAKPQAGPLEMPDFSGKTRCSRGSGDIAHWVHIGENGGEVKAGPDSSLSSTPS